ncbi:uncharacterized protein LOC135490713 [Lineus longissimus]|uniref:uncharacterized protein LOC135490713 n=1 Tax=Lineus longissimus TaxID=88925 RepID=UPI00315DB7A9
MASVQHDICAICLEEPKNPKTLPTCTHRFCESCLISYVRRHQAEESVACPTCTIACPIQDTNVEAPAVAEPTLPLRKKELCTFCSYKGLEAKADFFCDRCEDALLCRDCATSHGKKPRFRGHVVKPVSDFIRLIRCEKHGGRAMKFLCMGCDTPVCEICADIDHDDHELVDIGDVLKKLKDNLDPLCNAYECASTLQRELQDVRNKEEAVITLIQNRAALLKKEIDKRKDDLVSAVKEKTVEKQLDMDVSRLVEGLQGSLERGRDISTIDITNAEQVRHVISTAATLNKTRFDASKTIAAFKSRMLYMSVPRFIPKTAGVKVGELEYLPRTITDPVRLELGGKYVRKPCYKITKAVLFISQNKLYQKVVSFNNVVFTEFVYNWFYSYCSILMTGLRKQLVEIGNRLGDEVDDMIVNNSGELLVLCYGGLHRCISPFKRDYQKATLEYFKEMQNAVSVALTKSGKYVILKKEKDQWAVLILAANFKLIWGPIKLASGTLDYSQGKDMKILCPESTDLLLIDHRNGQRVSAISLAVRQNSMDGGAVGALQHYFAKRTPILSPVVGFYILDICCDDGKVYLCIKKGKGAERSPGAGPVQFYQATYYMNDKWQYTAIPLEDPTGKPFSELKKEEMLQLGAHKGTLMCFVYSPIPLAELKESAEPGMNVTWYHGQLP